MQELRATAKEAKPSRGDKIFKEEKKNMLILLEHYKLQLSSVLPKIARLVNKAKQKGNPQKLEKTK